MNIQPDDNLTKLPPQYIPAINDLPGDLAQLARVIEEEVPGFGVKIVLRLAKEYRGTGVYFHNLDALKRRMRDAWIIERYDGGEKVPEIARDPRINLSERQIWNILGREPVSERQMKLF